MDSISRHNLYFYRSSNGLMIDLQSPGPWWWEWMVVSCMPSLLCYVSFSLNLIPTLTWIWFLIRFAEQTNYTWGGLARR